MSDNDNISSESTDAIGVIRNYDNQAVKRTVKGVSAPKKPVSPKVTIQPPSKNDKHAECYNMDHGKRGLAIIFNHYKFDGKETPREGTQKDADDLKKTLLELKFNVTICKDFKYTEILDKLDSVAATDHSDFDSLVIAFLSHGDAGKIRAYDHAFDVDELWKPFAGNKCKTLAGKPKLFFIQACRGEETDAGAIVQHDAYTSNSYTIPVMADILVMYSTYEGHYSFRNAANGSWFIQSLCSALKEYAKDRDLLTILTFVNRKIAIDYQSYSTNEEFHEKKQIGTMVSTLTRLVYFYQKQK